MNILCFGDSNTYGISPIDGQRLSYNERWPTLLKQKLGVGYEVIEAAEPNRTLVNSPPFSGEKSGVKYLKPYLEANHLHVIIIQLGTNDLKARFGLKVEQVAAGLEQLINEISLFYQSNDQPRLVILSPATVLEIGQYQRIYAGAQAKVGKVTSIFQSVADKSNCLFLACESLIKPCSDEGVHWPVSEHKKLSLLLGSLIKTIQE